MPRLNRHLETDMLAQAGTSLEHAQRHIFRGAAPAAPPAVERTVVIRALPTRIAEAEYAIRYLRRLRSKDSTCAGMSPSWQVIQCYMRRCCAKKTVFSRRQRGYSRRSRETCS
ncbi:hypothetical protein [Dankookia sp. P2]|uniref:hypothetical protein n=1 Tax=Dankookia sp. P2 TaxID=3423955 RepID=UPI003D67AA73